MNNGSIVIDSSCFSHTRREKRNLEIKGCSAVFCAIPRSNVIINLLKNFKLIELSCPHAILGEETLTTLSELATSCWDVR